MRRAKRSHGRVHGFENAISFPSKPVKPIKSYKTSYEYSTAESTIASIPIHPVDLISSPPRTHTRSFETLVRGTFSGTTRMGCRDPEFGCRMAADWGADVVGLDASAGFPHCPSFGRVLHRRPN